MPRVARIVLPNLPHHVTQRGNNRQDVFFTDDDRRVYLALLQDQAERHGLKILGYCLMTNHVHLVGVPGAADSLAKAVGRTNFKYAQYVNRLHGRSGHLWQSRFYSCALDRPHLWQALVYVEQNPLRARMVRQASGYPWSSAGAHCGTAHREGLLDLRVWSANWTPAKWREALSHRQDRELVNRLRLSTHRGRPLAGDRFLSKLEYALGRRLRPLPVGRPRKAKPDAAEGKAGQRRRRARLGRAVKEK